MGIIPHSQTTGIIYQYIVTFKPNLDAITTYFSRAVSVNAVEPESLKQMLVVL